MKVRWWSLFWLSFSLSAQPCGSLSAPDALTVAPGKWAAWNLSWSSLEGAGPIYIEVQAPPGLRVLDIPANGRSKQGSATVLMLADPFLPAGTHTVRATLRGTCPVGGALEARATLVVAARAQIEASLLEERKDSVAVAITNTGNTRMECLGRSLAPSEHANVSLARPPSGLVQLHATATNWDSTITLHLHRTFLESTASHPTEAQGVEGRLYANFISQGGRTLLTPSFDFRSPHGSLWFSARKEALWGSAKGTVGNGSLEVGKGAFRLYEGAPYGTRVYVVVDSDRGSARLSPSEFLIATKHDLGRWHFEPMIGSSLRENRTVQAGTQFSYKGRVLSTQALWYDGTAQGRLALRFPMLRIHLQGLSAAPNSPLASYVQSDLRYHIGAVLAQTNSLYLPRTHSIAHRSEFRYTSGATSLSIRAQRQHAQSFEGSALLQHRHGPITGALGAGNGFYQGLLSYSAPTFSTRISYLQRATQPSLRSTMTLRKGNLGVSAQLNWSSRGWQSSFRIGRERTDRPVYLSYGHPYHLNAGASIPLRGKKATHDLQGRCVDSFGKGIEGIEVQCGDLRVQTDARGNFSFKNISEEDLLELRPFSFPFGHWPTGGLQLTAADRNPVFVFHRATSLTVDLAFSTPTPGTPLPMVDPNNLQLLLTSSGNPPQNFFPDPQGIFRLSHLSAGTFTVEIKGLPGSLRSAPLTLTLNEGEVAQRTLTIEVQPQFFPVQHL